MDASITCRICGGPVDLASRQDAVRLPAGLVSSGPRPGANGARFRCRDCGTWQRPSLPRGGTPPGVDREIMDERVSDQAERRRSARRLLDLLSSETAGGRLLQVGCGHGLLLDEARHLGYVVEGLELSAAAARHARELLRLKVTEAPLRDPTLDGRQFDAIILANVLEHLGDPVAALHRCAELLADDGALLVVTPDPSSLMARVAGRRRRYLSTLACLPPSVTLRELIAAQGLVISRDTLLVRSFWTSHALRRTAERSGGLSALDALDRRRGPRTMLSLGDERAIVARKCQVRQPAQRLIVDRGAATKVHVVLPAYKAARTIEHVAHALSVDTADRALLVDDASPDETVEAALACGMEVLRHPTNRGYGANQKTCYVRAALDGADIVVMVHGDNQYDPTFVAAMVKPLQDGIADVVIGSRLLRDEAIVSGMPRWKWLGNRGLTWAENHAFRRRLSEYHTGYRAFTVSFLRTIPFLRNSDGFVFDQEVFAQIVASDARLIELPIPTRYFFEASSVSFLRSVEYGLRTLAVLVRFRVDERRHRWLLLRKPAARIESRADGSGRDGRPAAARAVAAAGRLGESEATEVLGSATSLSDE